jgi:hypothetical protein
MGFVTDDFREWLAQTQELPESESQENPFGAGVARSAQAQLDAHLHGLWHRLTCRLHKWLDPDRDPDSHHGDGLTR